MSVQSLVAAMLATVVVAAASTQADRPPNLRLVSSKPLVVQGSSFKPRERVTVSAITTASLGPHVIRARASAAGSFRARLALFTQPCGEPYVITARGASGRVAVLPLQAPPCVLPP